MNHNVLAKISDIVTFGEVSPQTTTALIALGKQLGLTVHNFHGTNHYTLRDPHNLIIENAWDKDENRAVFALFEMFVIQHMPLPTISVVSVAGYTVLFVLTLIYIAYLFA